MRRGDGRESYPAVEFPRGTKGMVMVFSPRGERPVGFAQERHQVFGVRVRAATATTVVAPNAVRVVRKAFGATGMRQAWCSPHGRIGDRAKRW